MSSVDYHPNSNMNTAMIGDGSAPRSFEAEISLPDM